MAQQGNDKRIRCPSTHCCRLVPGDTPGTCQTCVFGCIYIEHTILNLQIRIMKYDLHSTCRHIFEFWLSCRRRSGPESWQDLRPTCQQVVHVACCWALSAMWSRLCECLAASAPVYMSLVSVPSTGSVVQDAGLAGVASCDQMSFCFGAKHVHCFIVYNLYMSGSLAGNR